MIPDAALDSVPIAEGYGGFTGNLKPYDRFGVSVAAIGDIDGDGSIDLAVGAHTDDDGGVPHQDLGAVWILFMEPDGSGEVKDHFKISDLTPGMGGAITFYEFFGIGVAGPGDIDGNGTPDLVVGAHGWGTGTIGAVRVILLDWNGSSLSVTHHFIFNDATPSITLPANAAFGVDVGTVGDLDGNGISEIAVGSQSDGSGAVWILFLDWDPIGEIVSVIDAKTQKIAAGLGGFTGTLDAGARFGRSVDGIGDLDGDGVEDIVVGSPDQYGTGSVWILPLQSDGTVKPGSEVEIATGQQGYTQTLQSGGNFGQAVGWIGTHPGHTGGILFVGATTANTNDGLGYVIWLGPDGQVVFDRVIGSSIAGMPAIGLDTLFGFGAGALGDIDGDGGLDVAIGQYGNDANGTDAGAIWVVKLAPCPRPIGGLARLVAIPDGSGIEKCLPAEVQGSPATLPLYLVTAPEASTAGTLCEPEPAGGDGDELCGYDLRVTLAGGLAIDDFTPALAGQWTNEVGGMYPSQELRVNWIDPLNPTDPTASPFEIGTLSVLTGGGSGSIRVGPGSAVVGASAQLIQVLEEPISIPEPGATVGLVAGVALLAVLARRRLRGAAASVCLAFGLLALQFATPDPASALTESVLFTQRVGTNVAGLPGIGWWFDEEGFIDAELVGDVDGNGVEDLAVSTWAIGSCQCTRAHIVFMDSDGTRTQQTGGQAIYATTPPNGWAAGGAFAPLGDRNDDGIPDLAISNHGTAGTVGEGQLHLVYLDRFGREASRVEIDDADLSATLEAGDAFSVGVDVIGDIDGDGIDDLVVGASGDDDAATNAGAVYVLLLDDQEQVKEDFKITTVGPGNAGSPTLQASDFFGIAVTGIGDLDGNGTNDIAVGATGDKGTIPTGSDRGAVWILFLDFDSVGPTLDVIGHTKITLGMGGFSAPTFSGDAAMWLGRDVQWLRGDPGRGGEMIVSVNRTHVGGAGGAYLLALGTDGFVRRDYVFDPATASSLGATGVAANNWFGRSFTPLPDWNGDEVPDLLIGEQLGASLTGGGYIFHMKDTDHDGLDDNLDNCPTVHNPNQVDGDDDGVGDLCDNCVAGANPANTVATDCNGDLDTTDPGEAIGEQCDVDDDGEGDACEPVEIQLVTTGTPGSPSWDLQLQCGGFDVTDVNGAIVLPAGITGTQALTLNGASVGTNSTAGPGLTAPQRADAIYFSAAGNLAPDDRLCSALDPPTLLGSLTSTGGIAGTQLAAAALTHEGVGTPGFGLNLAEDAGGAIPISAVRLVNGVPLPILDLELGPAVDTATGKRWEVLLRNATTEFHRVAFALVAPVGTGTADMRWLGCESTSTPSGARALVAGERSCTGGVTGFGSTVNAARSWTVGPQASPPGSQLANTLYVVVEGNRPSQATLDTLNPINAPPDLVLGTVELDGNPDLEPALSVDGVNDIDDLFNTGTPVAAFEEADFDLPDPTQVKLIGEFNPADDVDGDGVQDLADNCPFISNPVPQPNNGSFLDATPDSDFLGDACQCGESTDDGAVLDPDDFDEIRAYLSGQISNPVIAAEIEARCSVAGTTECNIRDLLFLALAMDAGDPSVEKKCDAALSPVAGP